MTPRDEALSILGYRDAYSGDTKGLLFEAMRKALDVNDFEVYAEGYRQGFRDQFYGKDRAR